MCIATNGSANGSKFYKIAKNKNHSMIWILGNKLKYKHGKLYMKEITVR